MGIIDLKGRRYGKLLVISQAPSQASGAAWNCRCDCGTDLVVTSSNLRKGQKQCAACGLSHARHDLSGKRFGRLTVVRFAESRKFNAFWLCKCDCGKEATVRAAALMQGVTLSCGCLGRERRMAATTRHGMQNHPIYIAWENMKQRCLNPRHIHYGRYGGRGIKIDPAWLDFEAFRDAVLPTWKRGLTLDRVDPSGNYEPANFEWVTRQRQTRNRENTLKMMFEGRELPVAEVAEIIGVRRATLLQRIHRGVQPPLLYVKRMPIVGNRDGKYQHGRHGMSGHPAYTSWRSMRNRCQVRTTAGYEQYGGRGITVCDHWQEFENFWADMGPSWFFGATLDRKDNDQSYGPDNCRWATQPEQANNRRNTNFIETPLGRMTIGQASRQFGIKRNTLLARIRYGWTDPHQMVKPPADKTAYLKQYRK